MREVVLVILGLAVAATNIFFWFRVVRGEPRFRAWVERRYGVVISTSMKGHWNVRGSGSRLRNFALEFLQLGYFMGWFFVWGIGLLLCIGVMSLADR